MEITARIVREFMFYGCRSLVRNALRDLRNRESTGTRNTKRSKIVT